MMVRSIVGIVTPGPVVRLWSAGHRLPTMARLVVAMWLRKPCQTPVRLIL